VKGKASKTISLSAYRDNEPFGKEGFERGTKRKKRARDKSEA